MDSMSVLDPKTLDASYKLTIKALDSSSRETTSVEARLIGAFAVSSIIIGLLPIIQGGVDFTGWHWPNLFLYLALLAYLWAGFWVYQGFRRQEYYALVSLEPRVLREHYWQLEALDFKRALYEEVEKLVEANMLQLERKRRTFYLAGPAVGFEIVFLLVWTFTAATFPLS